MAFYENVFIARQDVSSGQVEGLIATFTGIVAEQGGKVAKTEYWGLKNLSFRVKKNRKGHYVLLCLDAPAKAVSELERNMRIHEDVLRYLTVRVEELEEGPSIQIQARSARRERSRDRDSFRGNDRDGGDDKEESL
ncbi:MAG: 30S ribosomal protein S6 [Alphaproteobacteria bacterium]|nr:30S ribosomal protein S6 [Alphaproteobacteria bacterium]